MKNNQYEYDVLINKIALLKRTKFIVDTYVMNKYKVAGNALVVYFFLLSKDKYLKFHEIKKPLSVIPKSSLQLILKRLTNLKLVKRIEKNEVFQWRALQYE